MKKVILVLSDGVRPDAMEQCGSPVTAWLKENSVYTMEAQTVMPSVTLPCHMSLFHSVDPRRHGILTNTYVPQVRPVEGLCEMLRHAKKKSAFFYSWEELKDLSRPDSLAYAEFVSGHFSGYEEANEKLTRDCIEYVKTEKPDFAFLYLGWTDEAGHAEGWMSEGYMDSLRKSLDCLKRVIDAAPEEYTVIFTADHGGHDRCHGTEMPEDMTIPLFITCPDRKTGALENTTILDIAPTVTDLIGVEPSEDWEGKVLAL